MKGSSRSASPLTSAICSYSSSTTPLYTTSSNQMLVSFQTDSTTKISREKGFTFSILSAKTTGRSWIRFTLQNVVLVNVWGSRFAYTSFFNCSLRSRCLQFKYQNIDSDHRWTVHNITILSGKLPEVNHLKVSPVILTIHEKQLFLMI